jgi:DNA mismatch repair protein MutS2
MKAVLPGINRKIDFEFVDAFHPILRRANTIIRKETKPQRILLNGNHRILVISGPNAGGKSITLKTVGLLQMMLQSGLLIPVNENSKACFFQQILSDIGDNQSIENELSTYSYRLQRMNYFLKVSI